MWLGDDMYAANTKRLLQLSQEYQLLSVLHCITLFSFLQICYITFSQSSRHIEATMRGKNQLFRSKPNLYSAQIEMLDIHNI